MGILGVNLNNINLDDTNYEEGEPDTIILVRRLAWHGKFEKRKVLKKDLNEEIMPMAWHPKKWWDFCVSGDEKKKVAPISTECF